MYDSSIITLHKTFHFQHSLRLKFNFTFECKIGKTLVEHQLQNQYA